MGGALTLITIFFIHSGQYLNLQGRWEAWAEYWRLYKHGGREITGLGLGWTFSYALANPEGPLRVGHQMWRHVHNEWFQVLIEQGVVGLGLIGWIVASWFKRWQALPITSLKWTLGGIMLVFLLATLTSFPLHLWGLGMFVLIAYAGTFVVERRLYEEV